MTRFPEKHSLSKVEKLHLWKVLKTHGIQLRFLNRGETVEIRPAAWLGPSSNKIETSLARTYLCELEKHRKRK